MKEYRSLLPSLSYNIKKCTLFYMPFLIVLSFFMDFTSISYWGVFFCYALLLEVFDYLPEQTENRKSFTCIAIRRLELFLYLFCKQILSVFLSAKVWSFIWISSILFYFVTAWYLWLLPLWITENTKEFTNNLLSIYIWIFWVLLWLWFSNQQRILDKYNDLTSDRVLKYIGAYYIFLYVWLFILSSFLIILFSPPIDVYQNKVINYDIYFSYNFFLLFIVLLLLSRNFFYAWTSQWVLNIFSDFIIKNLKRNSTWNFFKKTSIWETFRTSQKKIKLKLFIQRIAFKFWDFFFWKPFILTLWYYKWDTIENLKTDTQILYRIWQSSIENKNTITFKFCLASIEKIFKAYLKYGNQYNGSDDFSMFIQQETKTLFELALKKDFQPEFIDIITNFTYNITLEATLQPIKNAMGHSETGMFERMLIEFCIKGYRKENSYTTSFVITHLKEIGYSYLRQRKYSPAMSTIKSLFDIWEVMVAISESWWTQKTFQVINNVVKIYYRAFFMMLYDEKRYVSFQSWEIDEFYKRLWDLLLKYWNQENPNQWGWRETQIFFDELYSWNILDRSDESKTRPIFDFFNQAIFEVWLPPKVDKKQALYEEIWKVVALSFRLYKQTGKYHAEYEDLCMFIYNTIDTCYNIYVSETDSSKKDIIKNVIDIDLKKFYTVDITDMSWISDKSWAYFYSTVIMVILMARKDQDFIDTLVWIIMNIIELYKSYNDENDIHWHNRKFLYKYILFISSWIYNFHHNLDIYQELEELLFTEINFKDVYARGGWSSYNELRFKLDNFPQEGDMLWEWWRIWNLSISCYRDSVTKMEESDYQKYCDYLNQSLSLPE